MYTCAIGCERIPSQSNYSLTLSAFIRKSVSEPVPCNCSAIQYVSSGQEVKNVRKSSVLSFFSGVGGAGDSDEVPSSPFGSSTGSVTG